MRLQDLLRGFDERLSDKKKIGTYHLVGGLCCSVPGYVLRVDVVDNAQLPPLLGELYSCTELEEQFHYGRHLNCLPTYQPLAA